jgi:hypothetical protein
MSPLARRLPLRLCAHMQAGLESMRALVHGRADAQLLRSIEVEAARRLSSLERALLKGLQAVADKAAAADDTKLATAVCAAAACAPVATVARDGRNACRMQEFDRFRGALNGRLGEIHLTLSELLPTARLLGASRTATTCLSCDQRVRNNTEIMHALAGGASAPGSPLHGQLSRAASPQALPLTAAVGARRPLCAADPIGTPPRLRCTRMQTPVHL